MQKVEIKVSETKSRNEKRRNAIIFLVTYLVILPLIVFGASCLFWNQPVSWYTYAKSFASGLGVAVTRLAVWGLEAMARRSRKAV